MCVCVCVCTCMYMCVYMCTVHVCTCVCVPVVGSTCVLGVLRVLLPILTQTLSPDVHKCTKEGEARDMSKDLARCALTTYSERADALM